MEVEEACEKGENTQGKMTRAEAAKLVKKNFLEALKSNDYETLEELLNQKKIDVDTVFEVEDENLILASYKQGKCDSIDRTGSRWAWGVFQKLWPCVPSKAAAWCGSQGAVSGGSCGHTTAGGELSCAAGLGGGQARVQHQALRLPEPCKEETFAISSQRIWVQSPAQAHEVKYTNFLHVLHHINRTFRNTEYLISSFFNFQ